MSKKINRTHIRGQSQGDEFSGDPYAELANAVVVRAVQDYFMTGMKGFHNDAAGFLLGEEVLAFTDLDMRTVLKDYKEVHKLRVFHYRGPVTRFGKLHCKLFDCYTSAKSEAGALNNIKSKYKNWAKLTQNSKVELDPKFLTEESIL